MKTVNFFHLGGIFKNNLKFRIFWENSDKHGAKRHNQLLSEVILFFIFLAICGCLNVLDSPFNKNGKMVPSLLYANNDTNYVTFWDEDLKTYRTYDQDKSYLLTDPLFEFEVEEELSKGMKIVGTSIVPTTQLGETRIQIQREKGCAACHVKSNKNESTEQSFQEMLFKVGSFLFKSCNVRMAQLGRAGHFPVLWMVKLTHIIAVQLTTTLSANLCFGI